MNSKTKIISIILSLLIFLTATFQECYIVNGEGTVGSFGLIALLLGWMNASLSFITWFANPFYFISIFLIILNKKAAKITASISLLLALSFLIINEVVINEAGTVKEVDKYLLGYWLWVLSITIVFVYAIKLNYNKEKLIKDNVECDKKYPSD